jgi:hypothetical protein
MTTERAPDSSFPSADSATEPRIPRTRRLGIAIMSPASVVMRASEMPPARKRGSLVPKRVTILKVVIIPVTVPKRPRRGATAAQRAMKPSRVWKAGA